jgi:hypothetical protein
VIDMRKSALFGAIAVAALGAHNAAAAGFSYNLIEGAYISGDDFSGFGVTGSVELTPEFFGQASIAALDGDAGLADVSLLSLGGGYNFPINDMLDVVATASLKRAKVEGGDSEIGFGLGVGLRGRLLDQLELQGGLEYVDIVDGDTTLHFGGRWYFTPDFAAGLDVQDNDGGSSLLFVARYDFGRR